MFTNLTFKGEKVSGIIAIICGTISNLLGGFDVALVFLVRLMILDYLTGVGVAIFEKNLNSEVGAKGIFKKVMTLALVWIGYELDIVLNTSIFRNLIIFFYIGNEGISLVENIAKLNVPIPEKVKEVLTQLKEDKYNENNEKGDESK